MPLATLLPALGSLLVGTGAQIGLKALLTRLLSSGAVRGAAGALAETGAAQAAERGLLRAGTRLLPRRLRLAEKFARPGTLLNRVGTTSASAAAEIGALGGSIPASIAAFDALSPAPPAEPAVESRIRQLRLRPSPVNFQNNRALERVVSERNLRDALELLVGDRVDVDEVLATAAGGPPRRIL